MTMPPVASIAARAARHASSTLPVKPSGATEASPPWSLQTQFGVDGHGASRPSTIPPATGALIAHPASGSAAATMAVHRNHRRLRAAPLQGSLIISRDAVAEVAIGRDRCGRRQWFEARRVKRLVAQNDG